MEERTLMKTTHFSGRGARYTAINVPIKTWRHQWGGAAYDFQWRRVKRGASGPPPLGAPEEPRVPGSGLSDSARQLFTKQEK